MHTFVQLCALISILGFALTGASADDDVAELARLLAISVPADLSAQPRILRAMRLLAEQTEGIDYKSLGMGWFHPNTRTDYQARKHRSFSDARSRARTEASRHQLRELVLSGGTSEAALVAAFVHEIGLQPDAPVAGTAQFDAVLAALEGELLLPLRAFQEHGGKAYRTKPGAPIPQAPVDRVIGEIISHVLHGDFSDWRYSNPIGRRQLEGLSQTQLAKWIEPTSTQLGGLWVREGSVGELDFFWATKIGGPSHGFDYEPQCLLPLLANARHKALLVSDPSWPAHPAGRAHLRLLWTQHSKPVLWLETVNVDFAASRVVDTRSWQGAVLAHVIAKAAALRAVVSMEPGLKQLAQAVVAEMGIGGVMHDAHEPVILRPSTGVVEASDYLSGQHDWVQMTEEVAGPFHRAFYSPAHDDAAEL